MIVVCLAAAGSSKLYCQDAAPAVQQQDQFFAGTITALSDTSITVTRTVLGKESTVHTFAITPETVIQGGKPKLKSKVTVKWVAGDDGDRALKIILRGAAPPPKKP